MPARIRGSERLHAAVELAATILKPEEQIRDDQSASRILEEKYKFAVARHQEVMADPDISEEQKKQEADMLAKIEREREKPHVKTAREEVMAAGEHDKGDIQQEYERGGEPEAPAEGEDGEKAFL